MPWLQREMEFCIASCTVSLDLCVCCVAVWAVAQDLAAFVAARGGGVRGAFIDDIGTFHKTHISSEQRRVRGEFFKALAEFDVGQPTPWLAIALLKAQYTCPKEALRSRVCSWISTADVKKLCAKDQCDKAASAEEVLMTARALYHDLGVNAPKIVSKLDIAVARSLLKKDKSSPGMFDVAATFLQDCSARAPVRRLQYITQHTRVFTQANGSHGSHGRSPTYV